jgi:hypothetical protein
MGAACGKSASVDTSPPPKNDENVREVPLVPQSNPQASAPSCAAPNLSGPSLVSNELQRIDLLGLVRFRACISACKNVKPLRVQDSLVACMLFK